MNSQINPLILEAALIETAPSITILNTNEIISIEKLLPENLETWRNRPSMSAGATVWLASARSFFYIQFSQLGLCRFGPFSPELSAFLDGPYLVFGDSSLIHDFAIFDSQIITPLLEHGNDFMRR